MNKYQKKVNKIVKNSCKKCGIFKPTNKQFRRKRKIIRLIAKLF